MLLLRNYVLRSEYAPPPPPPTPESELAADTLSISSREHSCAIILIALHVQFSPSIQRFLQHTISAGWESVQFIKHKQNKVGELSQQECNAYGHCN